MTSVVEYCAGVGFDIDAVHDSSLAATLLLLLVVVPGSVVLIVRAGSVGELLDDFGGVALPEAA